MDVYSGVEIPIDVKATAVAVKDALRESDDVLYASASGACL
jgi:hypothetical protein